jgi:hypothetical protein
MKRTDTLQKTKTKNNTECIGLLEPTTIMADTKRKEEKI